MILAAKGKHTSHVADGLMLFEQMLSWPSPLVIMAVKVLGGEWDLMDEDNDNGKVKTVCTHARMCTL